MNEKERDELLPEYFYQDQAAKYLKATEKKVAMFRKYGLLKFSKLGKNFVYKRSWLDDFMETWSGYDLSNEERVKLAIKSAEWKAKHMN